MVESPSDVPFDEDLVPLADGEGNTAGSSATSNPRQLHNHNYGHGDKKGHRNGNRPDEDGKVIRRCMCCDSRVKVPRELDKFRCMCCLTINDLKPIEEQVGSGDEDKDGGVTGGVKRMVASAAAAAGKRAAGDQGKTQQQQQHGLQQQRATISVERTRAIIDRCLVTYLENRCRRHATFVQQRSMSGSSSPATRRDVFAPGFGPVRHRSPPRLSEELPRFSSDGTVSSTPPGTSAGFDGPSTTNTPQESSWGNSAKNLHPQVPITTPLPPTRRPPLPPTIDLPIRSQPSRDLLGGSLPHYSNPPLASPRLVPTGRSDHHGDEDSNKHNEAKRRYDRIKTILCPLEDYLVATYGNYQCLNASFSTVPRPVLNGRTRSESNIPTPTKALPPPPTETPYTVSDSPAPAFGSPSLLFSDLDAKTLLLGDIGENGSWWTGGRSSDRHRPDRPFSRRRPGVSGEQPRSSKPVSSRSPNINWSELAVWYELVHTAGTDWRAKAAGLRLRNPTSEPAGFASMAEQLEDEANSTEIEEELSEARDHAKRTLLKLAENLLKRPSRLLVTPEDTRFLLILLANPSLNSTASRKLTEKLTLVNANGSTTVDRLPNRLGQDNNKGASRNDASSSPVSRKKSVGNDGSQHTGLLKRIFGLMAHSSETCHRYLIGWFAYLDERHFIQLIDLVASFVNHRLSRKPSRSHKKGSIDDGGLIPDLSGGAHNTSAQLLTAMGLSGPNKKRTTDDPNNGLHWTEDWQIKAAAKVMSLLFAANNIWHDQPRNTNSTRGETDAAGSQPDSSPSHPLVRRSGQLLHTSSFYNTLLDYCDMIADFKVWETKRDKFAFCQYPFFLSMGTKIKILEYDARRQMEVKAREAYFDQIIRQRTIEGHFHLRVRRDCLIDDSLRQISEAVGAGQEDLKKGLRVHFAGEEGVDAGGPRKEWFLMLVREIFDPNHGMFVYDEDSGACYFNPFSFETSDQYYLVGALLGLAIYNSTILDVALPSFAFRKLLAAAPSPASSSAAAATASANPIATGTKNQMTYTLADLREFRPRLAAGLEALLAFDGDVAATYCWDFVAPVDRYGVATTHPLKPNGENTPVTNANRQEFVELYVRYLLDTAVARQFEPFKRGFFTVCAGNALSLFRAEEIELLVRGSDEPLEVDSLRAVAAYENWRDPATPEHLPLARPAEDVPVIGWFWDIIREATPARQRALLTFVTGTDRIPAVGATSLVLKIVGGGDGWGGGGAEERQRFPIARTCFNLLVLWHYDTPEQLEEKLWRAVEESEGFGLK